GGGGGGGGGGRGPPAAGGGGRGEEGASRAGGRCPGGGLARPDTPQPVTGPRAIYAPRRNAMALTGGLPGWDRPVVLTRLREVFGPILAVENDIDAAALAERAHGHGREVDSFALVSVGTGIGMRLVVRGHVVRRADGRA